MSNAIIAFLKSHAVILKYMTKHALNINTNIEFYIKYNKLVFSGAKCN